MPDIPINNEPIASGAALSDKMLGVVSNATKLVGLDTVKDVMNIPEINAQAGAYTLLDSDHRKVVEINSASACNVTVPSGLRAGFSCVVVQIGAGAVTFVAGSGVTIRGGLSMSGQNTAAVVMGRASDDFFLFTGGASSGTTTGGGGTGPALNAPTGLTATSISSTQINLSWTDTNTSPNESGYKIFRNTVNTFSSATQISTAAANAVSYNDAAAPAPGTLYYYWVVASGNGTTTSDSSPSTSASATTGGSSSGQLATPTLTLVASSSSQLNASWTSVANAQSYMLQRALDAAFAQSPAFDYSGTGTSFNKTGLVWGVDYWDRIKAVGDGTIHTDSNWSAGQKKVLASPFTYTGPGSPLNFDQVILMPDGVTPEISQTSGVWTTPNTNGSFGNIGSNSTRLPSGTAGAVGLANDGTHIAGFIGLTKTNAPAGVNSANMVAGFWITTGGQVSISKGGAATSPYATIPASTTHIRLYSDGAGVYKLQNSTDGGATFNDFGTAIYASGGYVGDLWPCADIYGGAGYEIIQPFKNGF